MSTVPDGASPSRSGRDPQNVSIPRRMRARPGYRRPSHQGRRVLGAALVGVLVAGTSTACFAEPSAMPTVRDFLVAWEVGNYKAAARKTVGDEQSEITSQLGRIRDQLDAASMRLAMGKIERKGDTAEAHFSVLVDLGENGEPWSYGGVMRLRRNNGQWKVVWDPSIIHPSLKPGERLAVLTEVPQRAPVLDTTGRSMLRTVKADIVGVYPGQLTDPGKTVTTLANATKIDGGRKLDADRLLGRVRSAPPHRFLPLMTLQHPENDGLAIRLRLIHGLRFRTVSAPIAPDIAPELVGQLGPATADRLQQVGAPYQPGDTIGVSGVQLLYQRRLAGIPDVKVVAQDSQGREQRVLREWKGQDSQPVRMTLDRKVQTRAQNALRGLRVPASLVAVHAATGQVLGIANHQTGGRNLALEGRYPPGMTFGIVSVEALMRGGVRESTKTDCPATTTVGGQRFINPTPARGRKSLQLNFAYSCATTLASLSGSVDAGTLKAEAERFGIGRDLGLPVPAYSGVVPTPANDGEKASAMVGQGGVQASPLSMALVAGAVSSGTWRPPLLLTDPATPQRLQPAFLDPNPVADLKKLMRRSVFQGTAKEANVAGGASVSGVASTIHYGERGKPKAVSWFVGFRDDLAFAIAVEDRASASKIAATFLTGR